MPTVECTAGHDVETTVAGTTYRFSRDRYGRFTAPVHNLRHVAVLTSVECYRVVPEHPEVAPASIAAAPVKTPEPEAPTPTDAKPAPAATPVPRKRGKAK